MKLKKNDIVICKKQIFDFKKDKEYKITNLNYKERACYCIIDYQYFSLDPNDWISLSKALRSNNFYDYFYTKKQLRKSKLNKLYETEKK